MARAQKKKISESVGGGESRIFNRKIFSLFSPEIILFSILFFWFLYAIVDARLIFQARDKLFLLNLPYFTDFIGEPGLLLEWVDSLLVQLCYAGWPGALLLAFIAWALLASANSFMNKLASKKTIGTWIIPGMVLMGLYADYHTHTSTIVGAALAMVAANGWIKAEKGSLGLHFSLFAVLALVLYYVAGDLSLYCFSACCLVREALVEKRLRTAEGMVLIGVIIKLGVDIVLRHFDLATYNFLLPAREEFREAKPSVLAIFLYAYFPLCAGAIAAFRLFEPRFIKQVSKGKKGNKNATSPGIKRRFLKGAGVVSALAVGLVVGLRSLNRETKALLLVDYCAEHQLWKEVLDNAAKLSIEAYDRSSYVNHDVNRALYYTGQLPSQMLSFRQGAHWLLYDYHQLNGEYRLIRIPYDLFMDVGRVNEAEHLALEMMEKWPSGAALKRIAWVKMIKNQPEAAKVYLNNLKDDLVWGRWAKEYLQRLAKDPTLSNDLDIQEIRPLMIDEDDLIQTLVFMDAGKYNANFSAGLRSQLEHNNRNRMAFEYLMAQCLLTGNLNGVASLFPLLDLHSYVNSPFLCEEAIMIFGIGQPDAMKLLPSGEVYFGNHRISNQTVERFMRLKTIVNRCGGFTPQTVAMVAKEFPNSYFEFYVRLQVGGPRE